MIGTPIHYELNADGSVLTPCPYGVLAPVILESQKDKPDIRKLHGIYCGDRSKGRPYRCKFYGGDDIENCNIVCQHPDGYTPPKIEKHEIESQYSNELPEEEEFWDDSEERKQTAHNLCIMKFGQGFNDFNENHKQFQKILKIYRNWRSQTDRKEGFVLGGKTREGKTYFVFGLTERIAFKQKYIDNDFFYNTAEDWFYREHDRKEYSNRSNFELQQSMERVYRSKLLIIDDLNLTMRLDQIAILSSFMDGRLRYGKNQKTIVITNASPSEFKTARNQDTELGRLIGRILDVANIIGV
jgi:hypothetical protein